MNTRKAFIAVVSALVAWYGHHHGWGDLVVFFLVFFSGFALGVSGEVLEQADRELERGPSALDILEQDHDHISQDLR